MDDYKAPQTDKEAQNIFETRFNIEIQPELKRLFSVWRDMGYSTKLAFIYVMRELIKQGERQETKCSLETQAD